MAQASAPRTGADQRPLSPHLSIYRKSITMMMSIVHRMTGAALYFGTILLAWWLIAVAAGPSYYAYVNSVLGHPVGKLVLVGYTWALIHHMLGGIRHLVWDTGKGMTISASNALCWLSLVVSLALTAALWLVGLHLRF